MPSRGDPGPELGVESTQVLGAAFIDVRSPEKYADAPGHIEHARLMPIYNMTGGTLKWVAEQLPAQGATRAL